MQQHTGVIKRDRVNMVGPNHGPRQAAPAEAPAGGSVQARIVEQSQDAAVVEVVCSCGRKIHLNCLFAPAS